MADTLTKRQIKEIRHAFEMFDKDGDGVITTEELKSVVESLGQKSSDEDVEDMIKQLDVDNDGTVNFHEFINMMARNMLDETSRDEYRQAFDIFDENNDGFISLPELQKVMINMGETLSEDEVTKMMIQADQDSDGLVSFEEFVVMMAK